MTRVATQTAAQTTRLMTALHRRGNAVQFTGRARTQFDTTASRDEVQLVARQQRVTPPPRFPDSARPDESWIREAVLETVRDGGRTLGALRGGVVVRALRAGLFSSSTDARSVLTADVVRRCADGLASRGELAKHDPPALAPCFWTWNTPMPGGR
jgi:hypothetical protein